MGHFKKLVIPTLAASAALFILLSLGTWQLNRLAWKENLIAQVEEGVSRPPVPAPEPGAWDGLAETDDYRHVSVTGSFLEGTVFYYISLGNPAGPIGGPGLFAYAPFKTSDGWIVLVNRGFLPQSLQGAALETALVPPEGPLELTGLLRLSETPNWTTPEPQPGDRIWFARDTGAMVEFLGLSDEKIAPYSIDLDAEHTPAGGLPQAGETIVRFKNDHLGYALTWFGLAATLVGVYLTYAASVLWPRKPESE
ncbi:SURF1 family protein [Roseibium aggregatum]|uniref:SURF1-like protein n=1 Tax=Roseibium aggregatum TaxID=187304 RepID=A0A939E9K6_9HYPH|nr:SURF1 family protein [Roseibium aggregatum]MBN9669122.1 SURF1 family protein [Roseibium aggregatum]